MSEQSTRLRLVDYRSYKTRASSLIVLVETLKDCSPEPTILCTLKTKIKKSYRLRSLSSYARATVVYQRIDNRKGTNQIRGF